MTPIDQFTLALCLTTGIAYADELKQAFRAVFGRQESKPARLLDLATADMTSPDTKRAQRGATLLANAPKADALPLLAQLLANEDPDVRSRAASVLYHRQEPEGLQHLYAYLARTPAT